MEIVREKRRAVLIDDLADGLVGEFSRREAPAHPLDQNREAEVADDGVIRRMKGADNLGRQSVVRQSRMNRGDVNRHVLRLFPPEIGGELRCLLAVPLAFAGLWIKSRHEEQFMRLQFGAEYARYQARVKAICSARWRSEAGVL